MQNYKDPPPYPGHSKQVYTNQPGFRQSYSGSETSTDVSVSSNENLATTQRQEPQGEETRTTFNYHLDLGTTTDGSSYSILERLGMPASALDSSGKFNGVSVLSVPVPTISQDRSQSQNSLEVSSTSKSFGLPVSSSSFYSKEHLTVPPRHLGNKVLQSHGSFTQQSDGTNRVRDFIPSSRSETELLSTYNVGNREGGSLVVSSDGTGGGSTVGAGSRLLASLLPSLSTYQYVSPRVPPVSTYHHTHPYVNTHWIIGNDDFKLTSYSSLPGYGTSSSVTYSQSGAKGGGAADTYSSHGQTFSYLPSLPPPPEYPGGVKSAHSSSALSEKGADIRTCRSYEAMDKMDTPRSHPDLRLCASSPGICMHDARYHSPQRSANNSSDDTDQSSLATKATQMVELLTGENRALREEVAASSVNVARLLKFEMEIQKMHESHEALVKSSQKQEALWGAMRRKLEERVKELEATKTEGGDTENRVRLAEKDATISKLLSQNHDLSLARDQLEGENSQLMLSLAERKTRVDILEGALLNAQRKMLSMEEEFHKKEAYVNKVYQLQKTLTNVQLTTEKQQQKEKEARANLEKELEMYRAQNKVGIAKKLELGKDELKTVGTMSKILDEKEAKILQLESHLAELEQKYVKDTAIQQLKMDAASQVTKEVRLAAIEKSSTNMEKLIDEVKIEKLKHMEELHQSQRKVAELEAKVKQLQTHLVEKEAMVKVFQRSPLAMARSSSLHVLCHSSLQSPRQSLISPHGWTGSCQSSESSTHREFATVRHVKTGSASAIELGRKMSMEDDLLSDTKYYNNESKSDSEEEGKPSLLSGLKKHTLSSQSSEEKWFSEQYGSQKS